MNKRITYGVGARNNVIKGVNLLKDIVVSSLGPKGHNVIVYDGGVRPLITKDGATIAAAVDSDDPYEKIGIQLVKDVISKVNSIAGDGTTTTTLYTCGLLEKMNTLVNLGIDPNELRKGMNYATERALSLLKEHSQHIKNTEEIVARVAANGNEELVQVLVKAYTSIGENGSVVLADSYKRDGSSYVEVTNGLKWSCGIPSSIFFTNPATDTCEVENPYIMVFAKGISDLSPLQGYITLTEQEGRELVLVAPYFEPEVWSLAASNGVVLINSPGTSLDHVELHEALMDLAVTVGTKVIPDVNSAMTVAPELKDLGVAARVKSSLKETTIVQVEELSEEQAIKYMEYIEKIKAQIDDNDELSITAMENLKDRLARMSGGVATIHIGALTPEEKEEKIALVEDAQCSISSALKYGVLPGGGTAMLKVAQILSEEKTDLSEAAKKGYDAVLEVLRTPAKQLVSSIKPNDYQYIVQQVAHEKDFNLGYNVRTEQVEDLVKSGIVDSAVIEQLVVQYAASATGSFILSDGIIVNGNRNINYDVNDRKAMEARL